MWTPWRNKTGLTMVTVILATALCLSIASCGLNYELIIATSDFQWATGVLTVTAYAESALMVGSAIGLMIMPWFGSSAS
jgi:hypothetical protein